MKRPERPSAPTLRTETRDRLDALDMRARKRFGQNFLVDTDAIAGIVAAAGIHPGEPVTEIGPGLGAMTRALLATGAVVTAIELDRDLATALKVELPDAHILEADALRYDFAGTQKVVANLPYNVGTPILMRLLVARVPRLLLMFQKEVGDRIVATPDDDAFGALSVQIRARADAQVVRILPPSAFLPAPKVHSVVIDFRVHEHPDFGGVTAEHFDRTVRLGFSQRRKTLLNALGAGIGREVALAALTEAAIDPRRRAETVDLEGWRRLAVAVPH